MKIETLQTLTIVGGIGVAIWASSWAAGLGASFVIYCIGGAIIPIRK